MSKTNDTHKTNDTPKLGHGTFEDIELDAVTGGWPFWPSPPTSRDEMILTGLLQAANHLSR